jgi:hypothetical protein
VGRGKEVGLLADEPKDKDLLIWETDQEVESRCVTPVKQKKTKITGGKRCRRVDVPPTPTILAISVPFLQSKVISKF